MGLNMGNKNLRYVPKKLSASELKKFDEMKKAIQERIDACPNFEERRRVIYAGVDMMFKFLATTEEYERGERPKEKFEAEEFDVETFGDVSSYSVKCIDQVISEVGYGSSTEDYLAIEKDFINEASKVIEFDEIETLAKRTLAVYLTKEQLEFMKKTHFISEYLKEQQKSNDCEKNIENLANATKVAKEMVAKDGSVETMGQVQINGESVANIATHYIDEMVKKSYKKAMEDMHYAPIAQSNNPSMGIVCGLPGLGKSSIFINDLKKQGYLCVDLDDIAISISKKYGVPINEATSDNIYKLANMVHDSVVAQSMERGYNIAIEKIGYDKKQIVSISENMESISEQVGQKMGRDVNYSQSLLMAAGSSVASAESNSIRNAEQIFSGSDLRGYHYSSLIRNNNCTTYAYMAVLSDEEVRERFSEIRISDRVGCFEGLSMVDGKCVSLNKQHERVKKLGKAENNVYGNF